jgi:hypothetical protein
MKFIHERKRYSGIDYEKYQREENCKFTITRLSDSAVSYRTRRPRFDSKFWSSRFLVWDQDHNCKA